MEKDQEAFKMDELVKLVVKKTGIPEAQAKQAVDVVLDYLKKKLPAPIAGQLDNFLKSDMDDTLFQMLDNFLDKDDKKK
jgi:hypothetical protein